MSDLNPLKFQVAIQDDATKQLEKIEKAFESLKDKTISVKVDGLSDLQNLLSALQHLQVHNIGKDVANGIKEATSGIKEEAQSAIRTSLSNLAADLATVKEAIKNDNFTAFSKRIDTCAEAVEKLDAAFKKFHVTIGSDSGMQNFMTGLGEVIRNVRTTMGTLEAGKNGGLSGLANTYAKNIERIEDAMRRIRETRLILGDKLASANGAGLPIDNRHIYMLDSYMKKLEKIRNDENLMHGKGWQTATFGNSFRQMISGADQYIKYLDQQIKRQDTIETNQRKYNTALDDMQKLLSRLQKASSVGNGLVLDTSKVDDALNKLSQYISNVLNFDSKNFGNTHVVSELIAQWNNLKKTLSEVAREQEKVNRATEKENERQANSNRKKTQKENDDWAESARRANVEATKLEIQLRKLQEVESRGRKVGVDTNDLALSIAQMQHLVQLLRSIQKDPKSFGTTHASDVVNGAQFQNTIRLANEEASAVKRATREKELASRATQQLSADEQRLAQALQASTEKLHGQSQILSDLKSLATQYLGVWGGQQFLNNIIQIGGQLEMQRLSIGAILQNQAQANELFDNIKGLATKSPFGVVELDQMTKQLTAYGFQYNELFDMTKRLADISAATGTDVSRLALALGHVRSEAALSGYTLRQFSMGNVPMLQKLAEKLGKTTAEIRKMTAAKQISYDDVVGVLKDLTNEGGMFHNMQEVISQSVKAKFKNVKDAMDIMYGEMAEGDIGEALKDVANVLMDVTKNWKDAATVLGTGVAMWALHRAAVVANIAVLGEHNASTLKSIATFRAQEAQQLRTAAMYRTLSAAEKQQIANSKVLTTQERMRIMTGRSLTAEQLRRAAAARQQHIMDLALAVSSKKLTTEDIARQVAIGNLSKAQARQILLLADLTNAERIAGLEAVNNTTRYGLLRMSLLTAWDATKKLAFALKSLVFNPATLMMAGVTALVELWQRNKREIEAAEELSSKIYEHSQEALKNTRTMLQETGIKVEWRSNDSEGFSDVTGNFGGQLGGKQRFVLPEFDTSAAEESIEKWSQYIRDYAATPNRILNNALFDNAGNVISLKEQFDNLKKAVVDVAKAQEGLKDLGNIFENAVNATNGGWFDDDVLTNIADYDKALKSFGNNISATYNKWRVNIDKGIIAARQQDEAFNKAVAGMATYAQQFDFLMQNHEKYATALNAFRNTNNQSSTAWKNLSDNFWFGYAGLGNVNKQKATMMADLEAFYSQLQADIESKGGKLGNLSVAWQQDLLLGYKDTLSSIQGLSDETYKFLMEKFAERFKITLDVDNELFNKKVKESQRLLNELLGKEDEEFNVPLNFATNVNDAIDDARKQYKAAKEYFEKAQPILLKLGVDFEMGKEIPQAVIDSMVSRATPETRDFIKATLEGINEATKGYNNAVSVSKTGGFSLEEEKKKGKGGGSKSYKDEFAKRWDERIRIMKEAYSWYDKWEKKVGNDAAINETNAKYSDIFKEWSTDKVLPMDFDVKEIKDYQKYVEKIRDDALKRYQAQKNDKGKNNGQEALRVYRQAVALLNDIKFDNFTKAAAQFKSIIDQTIEDLSTRWNTYQTVRNATGNSELAFDVAGIGNYERRFDNSADALKEELMRRFHALGGIAPLLNITFDESIDEEGIRKMFEDIIPSDAKEKIDGFISGFKEWQKLQKQVTNDNTKTFSELIGSAVDLQSEIIKVNDEYNKLIKSLNELKSAGKITDAQYSRGVQIATANRDVKLVEANSSFKLLTNGIVTMNKEAAQKIKKDFIDALTRQLKIGSITAKEYADKISDINKKMRDLKDYPNGFRSYMQGGLDGLFNSMIEKGKSYQEEGAQKYQDAQRVLDTSSSQSEIAKAFKDSDAGESMMKLGQGMEQMGGGAMQTVAIIDMIVHGIDNIVQGLKGTFDEIREMYDALGYDTKNDSWEDANTFLSSFSSASSSAAKGWDSLKNGDIGGVIQGVVGSFTGWVTGYAKGHDKKRQNHIDALQKNINSLEANTEAIMLLRKRTLGYDNGDLRRSYASQYAPNENLKSLFQNKRLSNAYLGQGFTSKAQEAMYEYYTKNSAGNGYQQQFANLKAQREDYMKMYDEEADKKNSSQESLNEYKSKIAELDDQIRYFTQDLAEELFGIDIKGWADQLSDSLCSAFENGESAAKAYKDTVTNILQSVMNNMMNMAILEPMFQNLQDKLFGNEEKNIKGAFDINDPMKSMGDVLSTITDFFGTGGEGEQSITAALEFMNAFERGLNNAGLSTKKSDSFSNLSSGVQGTSEETSDLLAGYVNALRQDVAINRILLTQFVSEFWPSYVEQVSSLVRATNNIDTSTAIIRDLLSENGAIYAMIDSMRAHLDNITNGNESIYIK